MGIERQRTREIGREGEGILGDRPERVIREPERKEESQERRENKERRYTRKKR